MEDKPMGVNFFGWIRDGVKQSSCWELATRLNNWVRRLMQVMPALRCSLSCAMKHTTTITATTPMPNSAPNNPAARNRKRLGRSLKEIDGTS